MGYFGVKKQDIMKILKHTISLMLFMLMIGSAKAQTSTEDITQDWERAKAYTKEYLDAMPEKSFSLKPTPEMRSFADQMLHLADANYGFVSAVGQEKSPVAVGGLEKGSDKSKATVTKETLASYDFVIATIKKLNSTQLNEQTKLFGKFDLSKGKVLEKAFEHQTHHRGQATVYLRLAGVTPPAEKLF